MTKERNLIIEALIRFVEELRKNSSLGLYLHDNGVFSFVSPHNGKFFTKKELSLMIGKNTFYEKGDINDTTHIFGNEGAINHLFYLLFGVAKRGNILIVPNNYVRDISYRK